MKQYLTEISHKTNRASETRFNEGEVVLGAISFGLAFHLMAKCFSISKEFILQNKIKTCPE